MRDVLKWFVCYAHARAKRLLRDAPDRLASDVVAPSEGIDNHAARCRADVILDGANMRQTEERLMSKRAAICRLLMPREKRAWISAVC